MIQQVYYKVDDYVTYSKVDAFRAAKGEIKKIKFSFLENIYKNSNWNKPNELWNDLLKIRCKQLRDKYDYLVLWYSGGYDSQTVLNSFIVNQIPLDEIIIYDRVWFNESEPRAALRHAEYVKLHYMPNLKIHFIQINPKQFDDVYKQFGSDWIFAPGGNVMYPKIHRYFLHNEIGATARIVGKNSRRGDIYGQDKPRVLIADGIWYNFMTDSGMYQYMNTDCEFFYLSADLPQLHILQCHMVIDWFESLSRTKDIAQIHSFVHEIQGHKNLDYRYKAWNHAMGRTAINDPISQYGLLKNKQYNNPASLESTMASTPMENNHNTGLKIWKQGIKDISDICGLQIPTSGFAEWLPTILSDWYPIRPVVGSEIKQ